MAVTGDDSTLILAESYRNRLTAYDIGEDGDLTNRRVTLFIVATVWGGPEAMAKDGPTGQLLAVEVDCPAAQRRS